MTKTHKIIFEFPDEDSRACFFAWFLDGGGWENALECETDETIRENGGSRLPIVNFTWEEPPSGDIIVTAKNAREQSQN